MAEAEKGKGKGKGAPRPPPPPRPEGGYPKAVSIADGPLGEGKRVQVAIGAFAGKAATVLKVTGEGKEARWRVSIDDGPQSTWVDLVKVLDEGASPKAAPADPTGEGQTVEVVGGPHDGKKALVMKKTGEGDEGRWRVMMHGGGPTTWVDKVKAPGGGDTGGSPGGAAAAIGFAAAQAPKAEEEEEKTIIEVASGPHEGKRGYVLKSVGQGAEMRWRVQLDNGVSTWVDDVNIISGEKKKADPAASAMSGLPPHIAERLGLLAKGMGGAPAKASGAPPPGGITKGPIVEGRMVEVTDGSHVGQRGDVVKLTGSGGEQRFQVRLRSGSLTWADGVAPIGPDGQIEIIHKKRWPVMGPGSDDGEGETDPEMPCLLGGGEDSDSDESDYETMSVASDPRMPDMVWR